ncbi:phosphate/phosphite/phosphonate ABC transporter substrate-binding protein [Desulfurivibrio alkaliphilus]|uniref:Phosphonate ABC transporter, periplasmic phosphonate-binding protein n=1 Tax=Desulfurivibrio alkaliphilus (strain DSM 19089 / UNIQEM U267 / AHT2) TaxID=589865 RepID=D6YZV4_DESAT|nr:phosphate/phosphite/phosphonate ABC transporter substrate-binding protein [Desulfurivibrio alkaliphilus]ADH85111.1 phosphonate ABC transporter, periplasmic phosphonate-binding protein [Desulfurivibrio alkaliphilus AHT 2]
MERFFERLCRYQIVPLLVLLALLAACGDDRRGGTTDAPTPVAPAGPVRLSIGLLPEQDVFVQRRRYTPIAEYLAAATGTEIELKIIRRYGNVMEHFRRKQLDGAFLGSFTGAWAIETLGVVPLARPQYPDGVSTYYGMIFVRKDSGIRSAADTKGKVCVFVDPATTAGWLLPLHYFHDHGIPFEDDWFKEAYFSGSHEDSIRDVLEGRADIGAAKDLVFDMVAQQEPRVREELEILAVSPPVPSNTLSVRGDLDQELQERLKQALLTMHETPAGIKALEEFGAVRFLATGREDYQPVFVYARAVGLNLADYQEK